MLLAALNRRQVHCSAAEDARAARCMRLGTVRFINRLVFVPVVVVSTQSGSRCSKTATKTKTTHSFVRQPVDQRSTVNHREKADPAERLFGS